MDNDFCCNSHQIIPINRVEWYIYLTRRNNFHITSRTQFPLMLAYACIIKKELGLTTRNTGFFLIQSNKKENNYGQIYLVLGRAKFLIDFKIIRDFAQIHLKVIKEY